jgi:murein L,D-transpeptidase YafK
LRKILLIIPLTSLIVFLFWNFYPPANPQENADKVLVFKANRKLQLINKDRVIFECRISLGENPVGHKEQEGDERTPEGLYLLDWRKKSLFHKAIHISYPDKKAIEKAKLNGVSPGGSIMIHGLKKQWSWIRKLHLAHDWTNGCIAVTNQEMDIIWNLAKNGTPIEIRK